MAWPATSPVSSGGRIAEVDILRGFALFGILITNAVVLTGILTSDAPMGTERFWVHHDPADRMTDAVIEALFLGRFYLLFAFLFGYSFTLQLEAARRAGASGPWRLLRRCGALFLVGVVHVLFLWVGDILTLYAFLGLILLLLRKIRPRTAIVAGTFLYVVYWLPSFLPGDDDLPLGEWLHVAQLTSGFAGSAADTFRAQLEVGPRFALLIWFGQGVTSLGMFLLGLAAGKAQLFRDRERLRRWTPRAMWIGFGIGLPVSAITFADVAALVHLPSWWSGVQELINPLMTFAYVAVVLHLSTTRWASATGLLAPAGRMAASNYIGQSVVLLLLYSGYGLSARIPALAVVALGVLTFALQVVISRWWLTGHAYGPVEWVLRAATYGVIPRWRRKPVSSAP
ncbi:DUF418 domain-containing protein [Nocardia sp. CDC159]|uniref:DUF418 domain-containing protein n=1 Tax=Nocardia pulmonis TaxID=2951408 RepID=A0A9X2E560_9NOCA|nr:MULTISPECIES: DUF418 domain-containing protein [Nocardia]MCM6773840.1 DUF418 domain-containing protein [Nocardia pulmonis]MCM6786727.1 DUF418 domain-containing protein [Nocardia sp. CDC159]